MKILFLCDEYPPCKHGGIGTVTRLLAQEFEKKGNHVVVCGFYPYYRTALATENDHGVKVFRFFYGNKLKLLFSKRKFFGRFINVKKEFSSYVSEVKRIIKEHEIEIIEMPDYYEIFRYTGPKFIQFPDFGIPKVVKIHGGATFFTYIRDKTIIRDILYFKEEKVISDASVVLAISEYSKAVIRKVFDYNESIPVIFNGVENSKSFKYNKNTESRTVVFAGTITEKKGVYSLIRAWEKVIEEVPDASLLLYGKGSSKTIGKLKSLISEKSASSIHLLGFASLETLQKEYSIASCAIFPSYAESFGMAPLEAMQTGCPTIFTRRASGPELIEDGEEGLLVDPDNIEEIARAIVFFLKNHEKAIEIGKRGALKVITHFDISEIAEQHLELYNSIINKK